MSICYKAKVIVGYKLTPKEAQRAYAYLEESSNADYIDDYLHFLDAYDDSSSAIFGIKKISLNEGDSTTLKVIDLTPEETLRLTLAWSEFSNLEKMFPHAKRETHFCLVVDQREAA